MKKFIISYINWHDHELEMEMVMAKDHLEAMKLAFTYLTDTDYDEYTDEGCEQTAEAIKRAAFNCDGMVNAKEV
jgi:hypothetical protein